MSVIDELNGKSILIWGYGREGQSTERFLKRYCPSSKVAVYEGARDDIDEDKYDFIVKSPGIVMEEENPKYTSQTEIFLKQFRDNVIGVTGTKGKSTTSSMLYEVLKNCSGKNVILLGNIGRPCLDYFEEITEDTVVVFEMSCHQLAHVNVSPHIAVFLNLYEEHLDYYKTFEAYFKAKSNVTNFQKQGDYFLVGENVPHIDTAAETIIIEDKNDSRFKLKVLGKGNLHNAEFVKYIAAKLFSCDENEAIKYINSFDGLPHRLECVGEYDGITFYDDSISTIPEAAINAAESIKNVQTVLLGGIDRGIKYDILIDYIKATPKLNFICAYESGRHIYSEAGECDNCYLVEDLKEAVLLAKSITENGKACVLSPAAASYGYFKNFEERGDVFKQYVKEESVE